MLLQNIQYREDCPDKCPKVKTLGIWSSIGNTKLEEIVQLAIKIEEARLVKVINKALTYSVNTCTLVEVADNILHVDISKHVIIHFT